MRVPVHAGPHLVGVSFVQHVREPEGVFQPRQAGEVLSNDEVYDGNAAVSSVAIGGPYASPRPGDTPSRRGHLRLPAGAQEHEERCARTHPFALADAPIAAP